MYGLRRKVAGGSRILHRLRKGDKSGNAGADGITPCSNSAPTQNGAGLVGFSDRYNCRRYWPQRRKAKILHWLYVDIDFFVPLIDTIAGLLMDDFPFGESIIIGMGIALVMLVFNLLALGKRTKQPMWGGVVVNKYSKEKSEHRGGEDDNYRTYTEYTTIINTDAGKEKTIVEKDSGRHMYDYLSVGNRVRFHPKFGTYEKYDKSKTHHLLQCLLHDEPHTK